jgi:hypothetical protein
MTDAERIAQCIQSGLPKIKNGTLRFWGVWFGRPYDNFHRIVTSSAQEDAVVVGFDEGEVLSVWNPRNFSIDQDVFRISTASRVRWEWFYYGRPQTPENVYFQEFADDGVAIAATTNIDWHEAAMRPDRAFAAVEIV